MPTLETAKLWGCTSQASFANLPVTTVAVYAVGPLLLALASKRNMAVQGSDVYLGLTL